MKLPSRLQKVLRFETKSGLAAPDDWMFDLFGASPASSGIRVTPKTAMICAPVRAAMQAISEGIGQFSVVVYPRSGDGAKVRAPDHAATLPA